MRFGQDHLIWTENPGVKDTALPGSQSSDRAHGVDEETPDHILVLGVGGAPKHAALLKEIVPLLNFCLLCS